MTSSAKVQRLRKLEDVFSENTEVDSTIVWKYFLLNKENVEDNSDGNNNVEDMPYSLLVHNL